MVGEQMADRIQIRRDLAINWAAANPTLAQGEIGYETDAKKMKFGNGSTAWNSLPYFTANNQLNYDAAYKAYVG